MTPNTYRFRSRSEQDTEFLAQELSAHLIPGSVIALDGDLGAGKTRFAQALGKALGVTEVINSPTFTIIKEYEGTRFPFYHMDVYRITLEEADELGLEEYFDGDGITVVEWASRIEPLLPGERLSLFIEQFDTGEREFVLRPCGALFERGCEILKENGILL